MTKQPRAVTFTHKGKAFNPRLLDHRAAITDYLERLPFGMLKSSPEVADALGIPRGTVTELAREFPKNYYKDARYVAILPMAFTCPQVQAVVRRNS